MLTLGVKIVVEDAGARVLMVRLTYADGWHLPGGHVEANESAEAAARRELREECGLTLEGFRLLALLHHPQEGHDDHVAVFAAAWDGYQNPQPDLTEVSEVMWVARHRLPDDATPGTGRLLRAYWTGAPLGDRW